MKSPKVNPKRRFKYFPNFNNRKPKFKVGYHIRILKYKNVFAKGYMLNWTEEIFVVEKVQDTAPWTYVI